MSMLLVGAVFALFNAGILLRVCQTIPSPFIDEIFHIPQTQQYCNGSFGKWNNKITTPPGLYFLAMLLQLPMRMVSQESFCSIASLRAVNVVLNTVSMFLIYHITRVIRSNRKTSEKNENGSSDALLKLQAVSLSFFPLHFFFSFLYYTDPGSTLFVLAAYLANLKSMHKTSALLGLLSVLFRQTNIVWILFFAGSIAAKEMQEVEAIKKIEASPDIKDKLARFLIGIVAETVKFLLVINNLLHVAKLVWPYICVLLTFGGFILINGGIVLGDKQNHEATFHAPQILYFFGFSLFFSFPILVSSDLLKRFMDEIRSNALKFAVFATVFTIMIIKYSHIHIFLLSDNRHYTFYLCRYVLKHPMIRVLLVPVYIYAGWAINRVLLRPGFSLILKLVLLVCICAVTIPQRLIEFRYFILPYLIFRVNAHIEERYQVLLEFLFYLAVNTFTLYVFFNKEVMWDGIDEPQRIIW